MNSIERKAHWENVFETKDTSKVSWHQAIPETSLRLLKSLELSKSASIIDVGAGDSFLGDCLLDLGFNDISLLDISEKALQTIQFRLKDKGERITFFPTDILNFSTTKTFNVWHDRAVFHFLNTKNDIQKYSEIVCQHLKENGYLIIGTFSENGPNECSNLSVKQYDKEKLTDIFKDRFITVDCFTENHITPSGGIQNFLFCIFQKKQV